MLNQRHMLVGRCVVNRIRLPGRHDFMHTLCIAHGSKQRHELDVGTAKHTKLVHQLLVQFIQCILTLFNQQQTGRPELLNLPAQLTSDRPASTCYQHHLAEYILPQQNMIRHDRLTPQQVFNVQLTQIRSTNPPLCQIHQARQGAHRHFRGQHGIDNLIAANAAYSGQGKQHVCHVKRRNQTRQICRAVNGFAVNHAAMQTCIVIQKTYYTHFMAMRHSTCQLSTRRACAVDQHLGQRLQPQLTLVQTTQPEAGEHARSTNEQQQ